MGFEAGADSYLRFRVQDHRVESDIGIGLDIKQLKPIRGHMQLEIGVANRTYA